MTPKTKPALYFFIMGGVTCLFALVFMGLALRDVLDYQAFQADSLPAEAVVTHKLIQPSESSPDYYVSYEYQLREKTYAATERLCNISLYNRYEVGDTIPIRYLPDEVGTSHIEERGTCGAEIGVVCGGVMLPIGVSLLAAGRVLWQRSKLKIRPTP